MFLQRVTMCPVWTPLNPPPGPDEVQSLSDDAVIILQALRNAHRKKQETLLRSQAAPDPGTYYRTLYRESFKQEKPHLKPDTERSSGEHGASATAVFLDLGQKIKSEKGLPRGSPSPKLDAQMRGQGSEKESVSNPLCFDTIRDAHLFVAEASQESIQSRDPEKDLHKLSMCFSKKGSLSKTCRLGDEASYSDELKHATCMSSDMQQTSFSPLSPGVPSSTLKGRGAVSSNIPDSPPIDTDYYQEYDKSSHNLASLEQIPYSVKPCVDTCIFKGKTQEHFRESSRKCFPEAVHVRVGICKEPVAAAKEIGQGNSVGIGRDRNASEENVGAIPGYSSRPVLPLREHGSIGRPHPLGEGLGAVGPQLLVAGKEQAMSPVSGSRSTSGSKSTFRQTEGRHASTKGKVEHHSSGILLVRQKDEDMQLTFKKKSTRSTKPQLCKQMTATHPKNEIFCDSNTIEHRDEGGIIRNVANMTAAAREEVGHQLARVNEVVMCIVYKDGSSQLREPETASCKRRCLGSYDGAANCLVLAYGHEADVQDDRGGPDRQTDDELPNDALDFVSIPFGGKQEKAIQDWSREALLNLMGKETVKRICFDAQEMIHTLICSFCLDHVIGWGRDAEWCYHPRRNYECLPPGRGSVTCHCEVPQRSLLDLMEDNRMHRWWLTSYSPSLNPQLIGHPGIFLRYRYSDAVFSMMTAFQREIFHKKIGININFINISSKWLVMDPKVAAWLLDADHPPITFSDLLSKYLPNQSETRVMSSTCRDLSLLRAVMKHLFYSLSEASLWQLFHTVEMKLCPILAVMEVKGICIHSQTLVEYGKLLQSKIRQVEQDAYKAAGHPFQITSHSQLRHVLFEELQIDKKYQGKKLARTNVLNLKSTSEPVLLKLQALHPLPKLVLKYRQLVKLKSTYIDGILDSVEDGFIHTSWEQTTAASGRLQSANPNIQNIPKQPVVLDDMLQDAHNGPDSVTILARKPFVSHKGWSFLAADFQSIELRLLAHLSHDPVLVRAFNKQDCMDIFVELASQWLGTPTPTADVTTAEREKTKRIVYSVIYGVGPDKLAETLDVSREEAKTFTKSFLSKFRGVGSFTRTSISCCRRHGFIQTIFKRRRLIPNINSSDFHIRSHAERQCVNFVVQGSAADICKIAMIQVVHALAARPAVKTRLLVQIHDELLLEVADQDVEEVKGIVKSAMEVTEFHCGTYVQLQVPLPVSVSVGKNWAQLE